MIYWHPHTSFIALCFQGRMPEPVSARPVPKLRSSSTMGRARAQRPKTIHVDHDGDLGMALANSRGPRGSSSNISGKPA